jgi:multiple antibiotic resistance protein
VFSTIIFSVAATIGALLPIVNPLSAAPVFLGVTHGYSAKRRHRQAWKASLYMAVILLVTLFAGAMILNFFGITTPIFQIAGGLVITRVGFGMIEPANEQRVLPEEQEEAEENDEVALTPLAMPVLAGPGSIATTIALATESTQIAQYLGVSLGICIVSAISWITLRSSLGLHKLVGNTGMNVVTRIMGLILICVGIRFIAVGILEGLTGELMISVLREWLDALERAGA